MIDRVLAGGGEGISDGWVQVMGFHSAKLQTVPWIIGLDGAAILRVCLGVLLIGSCVKRHSLLPVGLFYSCSQNNDVLPRDFIFFRMCGFFCPLSICVFIAALLGREKIGYFRTTNPNQKHSVPTAALKLDYFARSVRRGI